MYYICVKIFNVLSHFSVKKTNTQVKGERLAVFLLKTQNKKVLILLMILRVLHKKKEKQVRRRSLRMDELPQGNTFRRSWAFFPLTSRNIWRS